MAGEPSSINLIVTFTAAEAAGRPQKRLAGRKRSGRQSFTSEAWYDYFYCGR